MLGSLVLCCVVVFLCCWSCLDVSCRIALTRMIDTVRPRKREKRVFFANGEGVLRKWISFFLCRERQRKDGGGVWGEIYACEASKVFGLGMGGIMFELTGIMFELTELIMAQATTQPIVTGSSIIGIKYAGGVMVPNFLQTSFFLPYL